LAYCNDLRLSVCGPERNPRGANLSVIAQILSDIRGTSVPLIPVTDAEYIANYLAEGLPEPVAAFALAWVHGTNLGEWGELTGDLERLIGHKPITTAEFLRDNYPAVIPQIEASRVNKAA
jgi:NAD(P)H dehydrogenase (quinone)